MESGYGYINADVGLGTCSFHRFIARSLALPKFSPFNVDTTGQYAPCAFNTSPYIGLFSVSFEGLFLVLDEAKRCRVDISLGCGR